MKLKELSLIALAIAAVYGLASCDKAHDEHAGHNHDKPSESADGDGEEEGHDEHEGHDHPEIIPGPNGGKVLTNVEPHAEFFVTDDRKVQITFVDDDVKPIALAEQTVSVIAGDRTSPTSLTFAKSGNVLMSDKALPDGNDFPVIVQIKTDAGAETIREKFNLNLLDCPTCDYKEYACTCCDH